MVCTRFGVGVTDSSWLRHRLQVFEAVTLPSVANQLGVSFSWLIFVGKEAPVWFSDALSVMLVDFPQKVAVVHEAQNIKFVNDFLRGQPGSRVLALIDDDDAWVPHYLAHAVSEARKFWTQGAEKVAFSFDLGIEWIIEDLVNLDRPLANSGFRITKAGIRPYRRPGAFLTMASVIADACGFEFPSEAFRIHGDFAQSLEKHGFRRAILVCEEPLWLYLRHRHADSGLRKALSTSLPVPFSSLCEFFGLRSDLLRAYLEDSRNHGYSSKRWRKSESRSVKVFETDQLARGPFDETRDLFWLHKILVNEAGSITTPLPEIPSSTLRMQTFDGENRQYQFELPLSESEREALYMLVRGGYFEGQLCVSVADKLVPYTVWAPICVDGERGGHFWRDRATQVRPIRIYC